MVSQSTQLRIGALGGGALLLAACAASAPEPTARSLPPTIGAADSGVTIVGILTSAETLPNAVAPWVCYGNAVVNYDSTVIDPVPAHNGLHGECGGLPYIVPSGRTLVIKSYGIEGYPQAPGGVAIAPAVGRLPLTNPQVFPGAQGGQAVGTRQLQDLNFELPAGTMLHVLLQSEQPTYNFGWFVNGELR